MSLVPEGQSSPVLAQAPGPSVIIRWSEPTVTNGKISEYIIERRSALDPSDVSTVARVAANLSREHLDNTVVPCLKYYYRVIAFTKAGGTPSSWSNITTQEGGELRERGGSRPLNQSFNPTTHPRMVMISRSLGSHLLRVERKIFPSQDNLLFTQHFLTVFSSRVYTEANN